MRTTQILRIENEFEIIGLFEDGVLIREMKRRVRGWD